MDTKTIKTPIDKIEVVLKEYITGRDKRAIKGIMLGGMQLQLENGGTKSNINAGDITVKTENKAIETIVISVGGDTENVLDKILDLKGKDYDYVIDEINKVTSDNDFLAPSDNQNTTTELED